MPIHTLPFPKSVRYTIDTSAEWRRKVSRMEFSGETAARGRGHAAAKDGQPDRTEVRRRTGGR